MWITVIYGGSGVGRERYIYIRYQTGVGNGVRRVTVGLEKRGVCGGRGWYDILYIVYQTTQNALKVSTPRKTGEITPNQGRPSADKRRKGREKWGGRNNPLVAL